MAFAQPDPGTITSSPPIGILISTYNRGDVLMECLRHLELQTWKNFEVVVVVDGSTDDTLERLQARRRTVPFPLHLVQQPNAGAARARNAGLLHLRAPVCLLLGDDIFATPGLVRLHLEFHHTHPDLAAAAVGYTRWAKHGQTVTNFMRWMDSSGMQFAYRDLLAGDAPDWRHFYTSNLSLKTEYLRQNPSHEGFVSYGFEDIELGYRLSQRAGLSLSFLPEAVTDHLHPNTFLGVCKRALSVGAGSYTFGQLWPEHRTFPPANPVKRLLLSILLTPHILKLLVWFTDLLTRVWCPNPLLRPVILLHSVLGYRRTEASARSHTASG